MLVPNIRLLTIQAPDIAMALKPGHFVIVRAVDDGERIPLTAADWDVEMGTISVIYSIIGKSTQILAGLQPGCSLPTVAGPLGNPMEIDRFGSVLCVGGCYGIGSIYPIARQLKAVGNTVTIVIEARSSCLLYWVDRLRCISDRLVTITRDGSKGMRGHIGNLREIVASLPGPVDRMIINGCNFLMMRGSQESQPLGIKTIVSLNTLMMDGTGMCGVCRVTVDGSTKFACVDGPHFDGHQVDWEELAQRRKAYLNEETRLIRSSRALPAIPG
jgi:ferredoxin--NADP+ reductase